LTKEIIKSILRNAASRYKLGDCTFESPKDAFGTYGDESGDDADSGSDICETAPPLDENRPDKGDESDPPHKKRKISGI
jgi:hypothetical protein